MPTPTEVKTLVQKVNAELSPITNKLQDRIPLADISALLTSNGLDPKAVQNGFQHKDEGRLHVSVGNGVFLTMTWYKFDSGRYEIVAYTSSQHDDVKTPAKPMDPSEKRKAVKAVSTALIPVNKTYYQGLGAACKAVSDALEQAGFDTQEFNHEALFTAGKKEGRVHAAVGNKMYIAFSFHKMDGTGHYEIVAYLS